ncbi:11926_t:CDS:2, partial [Dentiscutata erythropus]
LCGICQKKGHNRNTCPRQFGINTAFYDDGHNRKKCPWANNQGRNLRNVAEIRAAAKKYFEAPYYPIRMCGWCGTIGHNRKSCPIHKARRAEIDNDHKRALIKVIVLPNVWFDIEYRPYYQPYHRPRQILYRLYRPRRQRIPNYIAACGYCSGENHARNDPNAPC